MLTLCDFRRNTDKCDINQMRLKSQCNHTNYSYRFCIDPNRCTCGSWLNNNIVYYTYCIRCEKTYAKDIHDNIWRTLHSVCIGPVAKLACKDFSIKEACKLHITLRLINIHINLPEDIIYYISKHHLLTHLDCI